MAIANEWGGRKSQASLRGSLVCKLDSWQDAIVVDRSHPLPKQHKPHEIIAML